MKKHHALLIIATAYLSLNLRANSQQEWPNLSLYEEQCTQKFVTKISSKH